MPSTVVNMNRNIESKKSQSFVQEAGILAVANFAVKIISVVFKIPLTNILGESIGVFTASYSIYAMLFMLSTSGLPVAVSKLVSASNERGRGREAKRISLLAGLMFGCFGLILASALVIFAPKLADFTNHSDSALAMQIIAPSLFFICVSSAVRGHFQGLHNMYPTAIIQFIEAFLKLFVGLTAVIIANRSGASVAAQAACAISGVTVGSAAGAAFALLYARLSKKSKVNLVDDNIEKDSRLIKTIGAVAFPVTLTAATLYFSEFIDTVLIVKCLSEWGESIENAEVLFSAYTGLSVPIYDLFPASLIFPLGTGIIPAVSGALAIGQSKKAQGLSNQALKVSVVIAILCGIFLVVTGKSCIALVYGASDWSNPLTLANGESALPIDMAAKCLLVLGVAMVFVAVASVCNSLMNAYGVPKIAMITSLAGIGILTASEYFMLKNGFGILGAPLSILACYLSLTVLDIILLKRFCKIKVKILSVFLRPLLCGGITFAVTLGTYKIMNHLLGEAAFERVGSFTCLLVTGIIMVIAYFGCLILFKALDESDVRLLPKGEIIASKVFKNGEKA